MTKRKAPEDLLKVGSPTKYSLELAQRICELIATHDLGYIKLSQKYPDLPDRVTVNIWRRKHPEFRSMYAQAKCDQMEFIMDDIMEIADNGTNDYMELIDKNEGCLSWKVNGEHIQRSRVRIDTRKWLASKLVPRMYGDFIGANNDNNNELLQDSLQRKKDLDKLNEKEL